MYFLMLATIVFLLSTGAINASEPTRSEVPAPAPTKGGPITNEDRTRKCGANLGRALFTRWGEEKFKSLHDLGCIVKIDRDSKTVVKLKAQDFSQGPAINELFTQLIQGLSCDTRPLGPLTSAVFEITLQTYPNAIIKASTEIVEPPSAHKADTKSNVPMGLNVSDCGKGNPPLWMSRAFKTKRDRDELSDEVKPNNIYGYKNSSDAPAPKPSSPFMKSKRLMNKSDHG